MDGDALVEESVDRPDDSGSSVEELATAILSEAGENMGFLARE